MMKKKYLFDHIEKSGGSSLTLAFRQLLGHSNVTHHLSCNHQEACKTFRETKMISGHFWFHPGETFDPERYYLTIVRDPIDAAISRYFFYKNDVREPNPLINPMKSRSLEEFVFCQNKFVQDLISNFQTRHFMPILWDGRTHLSATERLLLAKEALNRYDLVGSFEYLDEILGIFCTECGLSQVPELPHVNRTTVRKQLHEIGPKIVAKITELNQEDIELYQYAKKLFLKHRLALTQGLDRIGPVELGTVVAEGGDSLIRGAYMGTLETGSTKPVSATNLVSTEFEPLDYGNRRMEITKVDVIGELSGEARLFVDEMASLRVNFHAYEAGPLTVGIIISDQADRLIFGTNTFCFYKKIVVNSPGDYFVDFLFRNHLCIGDYKVTAALHTGFRNTDCCYHWKERAGGFSVVGNLGFHFDGLVQLSPTISCGVAEGCCGSISWEEICDSSVTNSE